MHLTIPQNVIFSGTNSNSLFFLGNKGETFQISVLDDDLIRVSMYPDGKPRLDRTWMVSGNGGDVPLSGRLRDDSSPFPCPAFTQTEADNLIYLKTKHLQLEIQTEDFHITWKNNKGTTFARDADKFSYVYDARSTTIRHYLHHSKEEFYYGLGEVSGPIDKSKARFTLKPGDAIGYDPQTSDPLYKHFPFYITYHAPTNIAYGILYDNLSTTTFDFGKEVRHWVGDYRTYRASDGDLDYYLIYGPTIQEVVQKLAKLIGYPTLPPRYSLGYLGSSMTYTEAENAQEQVTEFISLCRQHDIPSTMFHISSGYSLDASGERQVFEWNPGKFPDLQTMADVFHRENIRLAVNVKPHILHTHPQYEYIASQSGFILDAASGQPSHENRWRTHFWNKVDAAYIDFTSLGGYTWWKQSVKSSLLDQGIDSVWNDNNEYELWDSEAQFAGFGKPFRAGLGANIQTLLMARASYESIQEKHPSQRPYVISRSACPGVQRYAQTWSGDNVSSWHTLKWNIPMSLGLSLSGLPNTGHDIGGFTGPMPDPELLLRWVQCGIFFPRFSIHSWKETVTEPWMYPEVRPLIREAIKFRQQLLPYLYTLLFNSSQTGEPIMRPLVYHFAQDPICRQESFEFMLGPNLLVAPIFEPGQEYKRVYLPAGTTWTDFYTGQRWSGGREIEVETPLTHIPLFVPAGGMIPLSPNNELEVKIFPGKGETTSQFTLIADDGETTAYQEGKFLSLPVQMRTSAKQVEVIVGPIQGNYSNPYQNITISPPKEEIRRVIENINL